MKKKINVMHSHNNKLALFVILMFCVSWMRTSELDYFDAGRVMKKIIQCVDASTSGVDDADINPLIQKLKPEIQKIREAKKYETDYAFINLATDRNNLSVVQKCIEDKKKLKPTMCIVIGIGGSNLGTLAVGQALFGPLYNQTTDGIKLYFADTVDADQINDILVLAKKELEKGNDIILNVVSKSGSTTETIANFEIFLSLLKEYKEDDYHQYIVATTDKDSKLWNLAQEENFDCLEVPKKVGGRFSVFSAVGLFPLGLIGVDVKEFLDGAQSMVPVCTANDEKNSAARGAAILYQQYCDGITIHDLFLFSVALKGIGRWYRQLVGESLGKEQTKSGEVKPTGITPTVSVGSTDLHSMAQLYLSGPIDRFTTFVSVEKNNSSIIIPDLPEFEKLVSNIQGKSLSLIMDAILKGTQTAYKKGKRPFVSVVLPKKSAYYIGQFLQYKMIETVYLAYLLDVNPFDQPGVERYKQETRKVLAHG